MNFEEYFQRDPEIRGETVLRGTRVTLRTVLASLAAGCSFQEIVRIIRLFPRSMSALSSLVPLLPLKRIYPSRACPLLSESKSGREYPYLAGKGAYLIGSRRLAQLLGKV